MSAGKFIDMTGRKYGALLVLGSAPRPSNVNTGTFCECQCECGNTKIVNSNNLRRGLTKSCGCLQGAPEDLSGQKFGKLTAIKLDRRQGTYAGTKSYWDCECECGNHVVVRSDSLKCGDQKSCGCGKKCKSQPKPYVHTHNKTKTREYNVWSSMIDRCRNKNNPSYPSYGGRGISVCDRWMNFEEFYEDMGARPEGTSLDRIDFNGNYCKENCRWADAKTQRKNQRRVNKLSGEVRELEKKVATLEALVISLAFARQIGALL